MIYITRELCFCDKCSERAVLCVPGCVMWSFLCDNYEETICFKANCAKLQPHVDCDKLHAVDCNLPLVTTYQTCINMFISSKHDNCVRPRACYVVMMLVLNSHLLHCPLLLDSLTRGPTRSSCTVSVMFVVLMRDTCPHNYIMSFCVSVFHPFKYRRNRWPSKGTRQVAGLYTSCVVSFLSLSMCCQCILRRGYPDWGFTVLFPQL